MKRTAMRLGRAKRSHHQQEIDEIERGMLVVQSQCKTRVAAAAGKYQVHRLQSWMGRVEAGKEACCRWSCSIRRRIAAEERWQWWTSSRLGASWGCRAPENEASVDLGGELDEQE